MVLPAYRKKVVDITSDFTEERSTKCCSWWVRQYFPSVLPQYMMFSLNTIHYILLWKILQLLKGFLRSSECWNFKPHRRISLKRQMWSYSWELVFHILNHLQTLQKSYCAGKVQEHMLCLLPTVCYIPTKYYVSGNQTKSHALSIESPTTGNIMKHAR